MVRWLTWVVVGYLAAGCAGGKTNGADGDTSPPDQRQNDGGRDRVQPADDTIAIDEPGPDTAHDTACVPQCEDRLCGPDGCGATCGTCVGDWICNGAFRCEPPPCIPACDGKNCGDDGCGGDCGTCFNPQGGVAPDLCHDGVCCVPDCTDRCCGDDGCGGVCSDTCPYFHKYCDAATCSCQDLTTCGGILAHPQCSETSPAPTESLEISAFIELNAIPLHCSVGASDTWDFSIFDQDFVDKVLFMFGEIHGSQELGSISAALFEHFVRNGTIDTLTMETLGMDAADALATYVETGGGELVSMYGFNHFSPNMFVRTLATKARALHQEGFALRVFLVETPLRLAWVNEQIGAIADTLSSENHDLVLDTLPAPKELYDWVTTSYLNQAKAYRDHIVDNLDAICLELDDETCERLEQLGQALWLGAFSGSGAMYSASDADIYEFFAYREDLLYYNYRTQMPEGSGRVYTHMGAAHCSKGFSSFQRYANVAARMNTAHPYSQGRVYTTTPAYGDGSSIRYDYQIRAQSAEPPQVAAALQDADSDVLYLSTNLAGQGCVEHPLLDIYSDSYMKYSDSYDAYVFVRQLTPEVTAKSDRRSAGALRAEQLQDAIAYGLRRLQGYVPPPR